MNHSDWCLLRLCRAAAKVPRPLPNEAPFDLETRIIAAWRSGSKEDHLAALWPLFRKALVCAGALIVISALLGLHSYFDSAPNEVGIVDSAIQLTLMP